MGFEGWVCKKIEGCGMLIEAWKVLRSEDIVKNMLKQSLIRPIQNDEEWHGKASIEGTI